MAEYVLLEYEALTRCGFRTITPDSEREHIRRDYAGIQAVQLCDVLGGDDAVDMRN